LSTVGFDFTLGSIDHPLLPMPAGTVVAIELSDKTETNGLACALDKLVGTTVPNIGPSPNPAESLVSLHQVSLKGCAATDLVTIKVTTPSGLTSNATYPLPLPP
jgi:hypothetical protein